ncbi:MAG TPA: hypothetical protein VHK86_06310 [Nitrososphaera sp.]|jgi:hypothetical protein|nr:hypothetical protein [Nitrososphaera sp.]
MDKQARTRNNREEKLVEKIHQLMAVDGQAGLAAKVCMLAGLTESEVLYCFNQEICDNSGCSCHKLHIINKRNGMTIIVINWTRDHGRRIYFALMPSLLWERFRELTAFNESDIRSASKATKEAAGIELADTCKLFYAVMKKTMSDEQIDILSGKAAPAAAKCCILFGIDQLVRCYLDGWERVGVILPIL